jgi:hypothetical protein
MVTTEAQAETKPKENLMASTWTKAAVVRRKFKAGPRRQRDIEYDVERALLECRILYTELRNAMVTAGIKTGAVDVSVGIILTAPPDAEIRFVEVLSAGGDMEAFAKQAMKAAWLEKQHKVFPIGAAFWQRDRESGTGEVWIRSWRLGGQSALLLTETLKYLKDHEGNDFRFEW